MCVKNARRYTSEGEKNGRGEGRMIREQNG
jgi:hypothetical protein